MACGTASLTYAQPPAAAKPADNTTVTEEKVIEEMVTLGGKAVELKVPNPLQRIAAYLIATNKNRAGYAALLKALASSGAKQVGSAPNSGASTTVAMKGLVPQILGAAVEAGAVTRDVKGSVLTFRTTPAGLIKAAQGRGLADIFQDYQKSPGWKYASRLSVAASFDTSKGADAGSLTTERDQLSNWSVRVEIVNHRDPAAPENAAQWRDLLTRGKSYNAAVESMNRALDDWPDYVTWQEALTTNTAAIERKIEALPDGQQRQQIVRTDFKALLERELPKLTALPKPPADVFAALDQYVKALTKEVSAIDEIYAFIGKGTLVTFDWTTTRDAKLPDLYAATAIWEMALGASRKTDFTFNAAWNFYRTVPAAATHQLKSFDVTAQIEHPLGKVLSLPAMTVSVAGKYSRLPNDTTASTHAGAAGVVPLGNLGLIQGKVTVPINGSMKVPLSITASNRTELIKEKTVRAVVGFTVDFDTFSNLFLGGRN